MKIFATGDWHLGNLFHGNDRLNEHKHFLDWLIGQIKEHRPSALLVAGDVFDNGNPSAAAQQVYYKFISQVMTMPHGPVIVVTAGNHDAASRLEAPREVLAYNNVEIRGNVNRKWVNNDDGGEWVLDYDDLIIPVKDESGEEVIVLAVPYLRADVIQKYEYSAGVTAFLKQLTARAREVHGEKPLVMMAHMYASGADIAKRDASERVIIGGQEQVDFDDWSDHPDYFTSGHIHKRQHIWNTNWARYTGSVLPMSFSEVDYKHGVDMIDIQADRNFKVEFLEYTPQHKLKILPADDSKLTFKQLEKLINKELRDRGADGELSDTYDYVLLKINMQSVDTEALRQLENLVNGKDAVHCKSQKIIEGIDLTTIADHETLTSIEDILNRDPMDTLKEAFMVKHKCDMNERQESMLRELLVQINNDFVD